TADPDVHDTPVPACPAWSVRDVVGHVAVLSHAAVHGSLPFLNLLEMWRDPAIATARDDMTDVHVTRSRGREYDELVAEWRRTAESLVPILRGEAQFPGSPPFGRDAVLVTDPSVQDSDV